MLSCLFAALFLMLSLVESIVPTTDGTTVLFRIVNVCCVVCIFVSVVQRIPPLEPTWYILADAKADEDAEADEEAEAAEAAAEAVEADAAEVAEAV